MRFKSLTGSIPQRDLMSGVMVVGGGIGRRAGRIALEAGISGAANVILIPEIPFDLDKVADHITAQYRWGGCGRGENCRRSGVFYIEIPEKSAVMT